MTSAWRFATSPTSPVPRLATSPWALSGLGTLPRPCLSTDGASGCMVFKHHDGIAVRTSTVVPATSIAVQDAAATGGVSVIADGSVRSLRLLAPSTSSSVSLTADHNAVQIAALLNTPTTVTQGVSLVHDRNQTVRGWDGLASIPTVFDSWWPIRPR